MFQKRLIVGLTVFLVLCMVSPHIWAQEEEATESAELPTLILTPTPSEVTASPTPTESPSPTSTLLPTETMTPAPSSTPSPGGESTPTPISPPTSQQGEVAEIPVVPPIYPPGEGCPVGQAPLNGEFYLLEALPDGPIQVPVVAGVHYLFRVSGTYTPDPYGNAADAQYFSDDLWNNPGLTHNLHADFGSGLGPVDWGEYAPSHVYEFYYQPATSHIVSFVIRDFALIDDNYGTLTLNLHQCMTLASVPGDGENISSVPTTSPSPSNSSSSSPTSTPTPGSSSSSSSSDPTATPTPAPASGPTDVITHQSVLAATVREPSVTPEPPPTPTDVPDEEEKNVVVAAAVLGVASGASCIHCQWVVFAALQVMILAAVAYVTMKLSAERSAPWYSIAGFITTALVYGAYILYHLACSVRMWYALWYVSSPDLLCRCFGITALVIYLLSIIVLRWLGNRTVSVRYHAFMKL